MQLSWLQTLQYKQQFVLNAKNQQPPGENSASSL